MKVSLDFTEEEIEYIKKISLGQSIDVYLKAYLDFNLFNKINANSTILDEFDNLENQLEYYKINQNSLAQFLNTTQPTISRFIKNKSKRSFLYNEIFVKYESIDTFIFDAYYFSKNQLFNCIFANSESIWLKEILINKLYLENVLKSIIVSIYEITHKELNILYYKEIKISDSLKKNILKELNDIEKNYRYDLYSQKNIEYFYDLELKYRDKLVIDELF